jgi:RHS repeat-associated protein
VYDALGRRRIARDYTWQGGWVLTNETHYVCDGMLVLQERNAANTVLVTYTRGLDLGGTRQGAGGIGGLLARTDGSGSTYYHADAAGNITAMADASGNVVARYLYDPFGNLLGKWGSLADTNRYRFSSKEVHPNSGLYYYGYRFYEPNLQRWMNRDPIREAGGINLYGFVGNSSINAVDGSGLDFHQSPPGGIFLSGPFNYLGGDTDLENVGAGVYDTFPLVGNHLANIMNGLATIGDVIKNVLENVSTTVAGDPGLGDGANNALLVMPTGWLEDIAKLAKLSKEAKICAAAAEEKTVWNRLNTVGRTPGKCSATGRAVIEQMTTEGKIMDDAVLGKLFKASDGEWYSLQLADMTHKVDAVSWWNSTGRDFGANAPEVRQWMLDPQNYTLDLFQINRSSGASLRNSGVRYLPPLNE